MNPALTPLALSIVLGTALGIGLISMLAAIPRVGAPALARRISPYVRDVIDVREEPPWRDTNSARVGGAGGVMIGAVLRGAAGRVSRTLGGSEALARRLAQAGDTRGVERFRARQLGWATAGLVAGSALTIVIALAGRATPILVVLPVITGLLAGYAADVQLQARARRRLSRLQEELPEVLEFLSMCLAAGEGILDSLRRVSALGAGDLAAELRVAVLEVGTGSSLTDALSGLARRLDLPALTRAVDQLIASIERGAPLARVLQAQADDAHEDAKRHLIERAGRAEIAMLVPLVFLILPLSVVFAIFPGIVMLQLGLG